jgi:enoyl-CoA hydratase
MSVRFETDGAVAVLSIDRPERKNAVDRATAEALLSGYRRFETDESLRVLVVTGGGQTFCAGADLKALDNDVDGEAGPMGFTRLRSPKPTIAAIEGHCVAGGLEIAAWCDLRVAARGAQIGCLERRWGVPLIDGGTQRLPRIVGLGRALDLVLSGRVIDAVEAERIGLVDRVVDDGQALTAACALARQIAGFPFACVLADRDSLLDGLELPLPDGLAREAERGRGVLAEAAAGAAKFAAGAGRHGASAASRSSTKSSDK